MASRLFLIVLLLLASLAPAQQWHPPTQTKKLSNGLVVVVSRITRLRPSASASPTAIGFRAGTGGLHRFAHLFEPHDV